MKKVWMTVTVAVGLVALIGMGYFYYRFFIKKTANQEIYFKSPTNGQIVGSSVLIQGYLKFPSEQQPMLEMMPSNSMTTNTVSLSLFSNVISNLIVLSNKGNYQARMTISEGTQKLETGWLTFKVSNSLFKPHTVVSSSSSYSRRRRKKHRSSSSLLSSSSSSAMTLEEIQKMEEIKKQKEEAEKQKKVETILSNITNDVERIKKQQELAVNNLDTVELEEQQAQAEKISNKAKELETQLSQKALLLSNESISRAEKRKAKEELARLEREKKKKEEELKKKTEEVKKKQEIVQEKKVEDDFFVFDTLNTLKEEPIAQGTSNTIETQRIIPISNVSSESSISQTNNTNNMVSNLNTNVSGAEISNTNEQTLTNQTSSNQVQTNQSQQTKEETLKKRAQDKFKALILKKRGFANIKLQVKDIKASYRLFVNGNLIKVLSGGGSFDAQVIAGEKYDVTLIKQDELRPVFHKTIDATRDETYELNYIPKGIVKIDIRELNQKAILKVDGNEIARIPRLKAKDKFVKDIELDSYQKHRIDIVSPSQELLYREFIDPKESFTNQVKLNMGPKVRNLYFALRALEGGPSIFAGINMRWLQVLETWVTGGIFFYDPLLYAVNVDAIYFFFAPEESYFKIGADLFLTTYIASAGSTLIGFSPGVGLVFRYDWFYAFLKVRYSLIDNGLHPLIGIGVSF